jgi:hypothetical protein
MTDSGHSAFVHCKYIDQHAGKEDRKYDQGDQRKNTDSGDGLEIVYKFHIVKIFFKELNALLRSLYSFAGKASGT